MTCSAVKSPLGYGRSLGTAAVAVNETVVAKAKAATLARTGLRIVIPHLR
jgi:hypothetical protein